MNSIFQPTANCQFTICLTTGVHPIQLSSRRRHSYSPRPRIPALTPLAKYFYLQPPKVSYGFLFPTPYSLIPVFLLCI